MPDLEILEKDIEGNLKKFKPISLDEMDSVKLMNRTDTKYFFSVDMVSEILKKAEKYYRVLEIHNQRKFIYHTVYFDTPDYLLYQHHHNGKLNRYKIRQRRYDVTGSEYFEIKFKTNKGWTVKSRVLNNNSDCLNGSTDFFLKQKTPYASSQLHKSIDNDFIRITLVDYKLTERATLDYSIAFSGLHKSVSFPNLGILEVKQDSYSGRPVLLEIMKDLKIRPAGISKYCLGVASLYSCVKTNLLKQNISKINNLI
jgi:hypothetical protein